MSHGFKRMDTDKKIFRQDKQDKQDKSDKRNNHENHVNPVRKNQCPSV